MSGIDRRTLIGSRGKLVDLTDVTTTGAAVDSLLAVGPDTASFRVRTPAQVKAALSLAKADVGLGNVDNTADTAKPVSTATQTALDAKAGLTGTNTFTGTQRFNGLFGVNKIPSARQPMNIGSTLDASAAGTEDHVAMVLSPTITGDFTGSTGSSPGFVWGLNTFVSTGSNPGDGVVGSQLVGSLFELSIQTPAGSTIPYASGMQVEAAFFGASAGATVTQMESMRVCSPKRKAGATAGTATTAYCLFVEQANGSDVGASSAFSVYVAGGVSRFLGRVDTGGTLASISGAHELFAGFARTDGASVQVDGNTSGGSTGHATAFLSKAGSAFRVHDGTNPVFILGRDGIIVPPAVGSRAIGVKGLAGQTANIFEVGPSSGTLFARIDSTGKLRITTEIIARDATDSANIAGIGTTGFRWYSASLEQTTVGAAGAAAALPATPTKYLKVADSTGTSYVIPAYAAS